MGSNKRAIKVRIRSRCIQLSGLSKLRIIAKGEQILMPQTNQPLFIYDLCQYQLPSGNHFSQDATSEPVNSFLVFPMPLVLLVSQTIICQQFYAKHFYQLYQKAGNGSHFLNYICNMSLIQVKNIVNQTAINLNE